jgi:hypothetical protein
MRVATSTLAMLLRVRVTDANTRDITFAVLQVSMGGAHGVSTTREGKKVTVAALKEDLKKSTMVSVMA